MTRKRVAVVIAALAVTVGAGLAVNEYASAQGRGWGARPAFYGGMHMGFGGGPLISQALAQKDELKLNANQVQKLEQLRTDFYKKAARERIEIQALQLEIQKLRLADKLDVAAVEKQLRAIEKRRTDLQIERLKVIEQAKEVLTPEQLKQLETTGFGPGSRFGRGGMMGPGFGGGFGMMGQGGMMMGPGGMMGQGRGTMMGPGRGMGMGPGGGWGTETPTAPPTQQQ